MRVIVLPRRALAWVALVVCCGALVWYALSGPSIVTTGVAVHHPGTPVQPHQSGTPTPVPGDGGYSSGAEAGAGRAADFAVELAMEREHTRAERLDWLRSIASDPSATDLTRESAQRRLLDELDRAAKEEELVALLAAEGFADSVVVLNDRGLTLSVRGRLTDPATVARLGELASRMSGVPPERIVIMDGR